MDLIKSGRYMYNDILLCQNMHSNKNKHSGGVSCSACNAFIDHTINYSAENPLLAKYVPSSTINELGNNKVNKMTCGPRKDSKQPDQS